MTTLGIAHGNCPDGGAAALLLWRKYRTEGKVEIFYSGYGDKDAKNCIGWLRGRLADAKRVVIVDITPAKEVRDLLAEHCDRIDVALYDHHEGAFLAEEARRGIATYMYDVGECGASLFAKVHPESTKGLCPRFVELIRDFDLWEHKFEETHAFHAGFCALMKKLAPYGLSVSVENMEALEAHLVGNGACEDIIAAGTPIIAWQDGWMARAAREVFVLRMPWSGGPTEVLCCMRGDTSDNSRLAAFLAKKYDAVATAVLAPEWDAPGVYRISIRSQTTDLLPMCKELGIANGHPHAVGGTITEAQRRDWLVEESDRRVDE